jgi:hypothetical protein
MLARQMDFEDIKDECPFSVNSLAALIKEIHYRVEIYMDKPMFYEGKEHLIRLLCNRRRKKGPFWRLCYITGNGEWVRKKGKWIPD